MLIIYNGIDMAGRRALEFTKTQNLLGICKLIQTNQNPPATIGSPSLGCTKASQDPMGCTWASKDLLGI